MSSACGQTATYQSGTITSNLRSSKTSTGGLASMRPIVPIVLFATVMLGSVGTAIAQNVEIIPDEPVYLYEPLPPNEVPVRPANCGEFRYWDGESCVDARVVPPDIR